MALVLCHSPPQLKYWDSSQVQKNPKGKKIALDLDEVPRTYAWILRFVLTT